MNVAIMHGYVNIAWGGEPPRAGKRWQRKQAINVHTKSYIKDHIACVAVVNFIYLQGLMKQDVLFKNFASISMR